MASGKKWGLRIGLIGGFVLIGLFGIYLVLHLRANAALEGEMEKIREKGEPIEFSDLIPEPIPDEENAAVPLEKALVLVSKPNDSPEEALDDLFADPLGVSEENLKKVSEWLAANKEAESKTREAFSRKKCRFDLDYANPFTMKLPPLMEMRSVFKIVLARAAIAARRGQGDVAYADLSAALNGCRVCFENAVLIMHMIRLAILQTTLDMLENALIALPPSAENAARVKVELAKYDLHQMFHETLLGERCFGMYAFASVISGKTTANNLAGQTGTGRPSVALSLTPKFIFRSDQAAYLRCMTPLVDMAKKDYFEIRDDLDSATDGSDLPWTAIMTTILLPGLKPTFAVNEAVRARLAQAEIALALWRYRADGGSFPESLTVLVPDDLAAVPTDPFTGKPMMFKRVADDEVLLYSLGVDGVDDGGVASKTISKEGGDIVWRLEARKKE